MMNDLSRIIDDYYHWLSAKTHLIEDEKTGWTAISTPFTGIFNDGIEIYCKRQNGKWILSDAGETTNSLEESGISIGRSPKRKQFVERIVKNYGVVEKEGEFYVEASRENFSQKKHYLLQAILELHDLEYLSTKAVRSFFKENVENDLIKRRVIHTKDVKFTGYNGLDYHFDFHFPAFDKEIVLKATEQIRQGTISAFVYSWQNVKKIREEKNKKSFEATILVNDFSHEPKSDLMDALTMEGIMTHRWSKKEAFYKYISGH